MIEEKPLPITGREKTVRALLSGARFTIDYFQREYKWQTRNIVELIDDLADKFLDNYRPEHQRFQVEGYSSYFLGSVVVSRKKGRNFIIDGQQRLTSLTLLMIYLNNLQGSQPEGIQVEVRNLIFSEQYGTKSFNLDIPERTTCMNALYKNESFPVDHGTNESVRTIVARYEEINQNFPDDLKGAALPYFIDWLLDSVYLVEITAYSDEDAYIIFETMNDRGLSLSPTDMLKGYLLSNIVNEQHRTEALAVWNHQIAELVELGKDEEIDFFKTWLRAKYADTIRERKQGARNQDFENIGNAFHKWVRENAERIGLRQSEDFHRFIVRELVFFNHQYIRVRKAAIHFDPALEAVYFNAENNFTLQYMLLLAPLKSSDEKATVESKLRVVSSYIDIFVARRVWNSRTLGYSSIVYTMFNLMREIRSRGQTELAALLHKRVEDMEETFDRPDPFYLHQQNYRFIRHLLARMAYHIERECGVESNFVAYTSREIKKPFEVEHLWSWNYGEHRDEFTDSRSFQEYRNRIGGLVLLPRGFNQSLGDAPYEKKLDTYLQQNYLARTLHPKAYEHNPSLQAFIARTGLPLRPHPQFKRADLDQRQALYAKLCEQIWSLERLNA